MKRLIFVVSLGTLMLTAVAAQAQEFSTGPVRLPPLLEQVRQANPDLEAARARFEAARHVGAQVSALPDPELSVAWSPKPTQTRAGPIDWRVGIRQKFPFWGERALHETRADHQALAEESLVHATQFDLELQTRLAFFDWLFAREALAINDANRKLLSQFQHIAEQRYRAGLVPQSDPLKASVALAKIEAMDAGYQRAVKDVRAQINVLLNRPPLAPLGEPQAPPLVLDLPEFQDLATRALNKRPELRAAEEQIAAHEAMLELGRKDYWPDLSIGADYAFVDGGTNSGFPKDGDDVASVMVGLNVPLQLGRRNSAIDERAARVGSARSRAHALSRQVQLEVHHHYTRLKEMREVLALYRERIVPSVRLELNATRQAYSSARASFLELLDSERSLEEVLMQQARALRDYRRSQARLERAVGAPLTGVSSERSEP